MIGCVVFTCRLREVSEALMDCVGEANPVADVLDVQQHLGGAQLLCNIG